MRVYEVRFIKDNTMYEVEIPNVAKFLDKMVVCITKGQLKKYHGNAVKKNIAKAALKTNYGQNKRKADASLCSVSFKKGDRAYHERYGKCIVTNVDTGHGTLTCLFINEMTGEAKERNFSIQYVTENQLMKKE